MLVPTTHINQSIDRGGKLAQLAFVKRNEFALKRRGLLGRALFAVKPTTEFDFLRPLLGRLSANTRFLDVGCGAGTLLRSLKGLGFQCLTGLDPFIEKNLQVAEGFVIEKKDLTAATGAYDIVMLHHSLEHMPDQFAALQAVNRLMVDEGVCVIRIPLSSSYAWEHYRENWSQLDAPRHFYLHSVDSMKRIASQCGFAVSAIKYDSSAFQFWGSEQYARNIALQEPDSFAINKDTPIFSREELTGFQALATELNEQGRGDQAIFYLNKV